MGIPVAGAAARRGVSPQRIRALTASGQLLAEHVGRDWSVDPASLDLLPASASRPLSPRMARALLSLAAGERPEGLDPAELSRARARLAHLRASDQPAVLLRSWFARSERRLMFVGKDLFYLGADARLSPAGLSLPNGELNDAGVVEAVVASEDVDAVAVHHMLRPAGPADANVIVHVGPGWHDPSMWLMSAVHLSQHADRSGREDAEVARIVAAHG